MDLGYKSLLHDILRAALPPNVHILATIDASITNSRSEAIIGKVKLRIVDKGINIDVFAKCTRENPLIRTKSAAAVEVEINAVTSRAVALKVCPHFTFCYNEVLGCRTKIERKNAKYVVLLSEILNGMTLYDCMKHHHILKDPTTQIVILVQMMHALHTLHLMGIKHMDLHYGNIYLIPTYKSSGYNTYNIYLNKNDGYSKFHLPEVGYEVKLIDYDGSIKFSRFDILNKRELGVKINNPEMRQYLPGIMGNVRNTQMTNLYKFLKGNPQDPKNTSEPLSFINGQYGISGKHGYFLKKYSNLLTNNKKYLVKMKSTLRDLGVSETIGNYFNIFHFLVNSSGKHINLPPKVLKTTAMFFEHLEDFKKRPPGKPYNTYDMETIMKRKKSLYYTPRKPSPKSVMSISNSNSNVSPMNINKQNVPYFINKNVNINSLIIDPITQKRISLHDARAIPEEMKNGKITRLYSSSSLKKWMNKYNPIIVNGVPKYILPNGKYLSKKYSRLALNNESKTFLKDYLA